MTIKANRYYLRANRQVVDCWNRYQAGEVLMTLHGRPKSFGSMERACQYRSNSGLYDYFGVIRGDALLYLRRWS